MFVCDIEKKGDCLVVQYMNNFNLLEYVFGRGFSPVHPMKMIAKLHIWRPLRRTLKPRGVGGRLFKAL